MIESQFCFCSQDGTQKNQKTFVHVQSEIGAYEAEEIGVEHLLRDVKDSTVSTLATEVGLQTKGSSSGLGPAAACFWKLSRYASAETNVRMV